MSARSALEVVRRKPEVIRVETSPMLLVVGLERWEDCAQGKYGHAGLSSQTYK